MYCATFQNSLIFAPEKDFIEEKRLSPPIRLEGTSGKIQRRYDAALDWSVSDPEKRRFF
jgi:hypothetical protein